MADYVCGEDKEMEDAPYMSPEPEVTHRLKVRVMFSGRGEPASLSDYQLEALVEEDIK